MIFIYLSVASFIAWFISMLAGGGSPMILIPLVTFLLTPQAVAPVITTGMLVGNSQRVFVFWKEIDWKVTAWYIPGSIIGSLLGAYTLTLLNLEWLELVIGFFLILSVLSFGFGKKERTFKVVDWHFLPVSFFHAFSSALVGSTGPVANPFYLNYGLLKEKMIATKSFNVVIIHIVKMISYGVLGILTPEYVGYGLVIGAAAIPANWIGHQILKKMSDQLFRQLVLFLMLISGTLMLWQQRQVLGIG